MGTNSLVYIESTFYVNNMHSLIIPEDVICERMHTARRERSTLGARVKKNKHVNSNMTASLGLSPRGTLIRVSKTLIIFVQLSMCRPPRTAVGSD